MASEVAQKKSKYFCFFPNKMAAELLYYVCKAGMLRGKRRDSRTSSSIRSEQVPHTHSVLGSSPRGSTILLELFNLIFSKGFK